MSHFFAEMECKECKVKWNVERGVVGTWHFGVPGDNLCPTCKKEGTCVPVEMPEFTITTNHVEGDEYTYVKVIEGGFINECQYCHGAGVEMVFGGPDRTCRCKQPTFG